MIGMVENKGMNRTMPGELQQKERDGSRRIGQTKILDKKVESCTERGGLDSDGDERVWSTKNMWQVWTFVQQANNIQTCPPTSKKHCKTY